MSQPASTALGAARVLLGILRVLNLVVGVGLVLGFLASFAFEPVFVAFFTKRPASIDPGWLMPTLRLWMVLALPMVAVVHVLLARLVAVVGTVGAGDPFVAENAARLKTVAWCMLALQLLHLVFGAMAGLMNAAGSRIDWSSSLGGSLNGWLGVALVFVLAQVFAEGTRMRADLEKMI